MARNWVIYGNTMVAVAFGAHRSGQFPVQGALSYFSGQDVVNFLDPRVALSPTLPPPVSGARTIELGLSLDEIKITPIFNHSDIMVNDMGKSPGDVQWVGGGCNITMRLVNYDKAVLNTCMSESMGGGNPFFPVVGRFEAGDQSPVGTLMMGNLKAQITRTLSGISFYPTDISGCHYIGLSIQPTGPTPAGVVREPWYFYQTYLSSPPVVLPIGTKYSITELNWRAVPVPGFLSGGEMVSSGSYIWANIIPYIIQPPGFNL